MAIKSIDIDGKRVYLELSKSGNVIDSAMIVPPNVVEDTYTYIKDLDYSKDVKVIQVHFKNAFRGADQNLATVDRVWQVSDTNSSQLINNNSDRLIITSGTPLKLDEGYELALKSINIDGDNAYLELSKKGKVVDATIIIPANAVEDTYTYTKGFRSFWQMSKSLKFISKMHFVEPIRT